MTDKEVKRLTRAQLIEIIYQLQLKQDMLTQENEKLKKDLLDKRIRITEAGNIAEAALEMNDCFRSAQKAAEQYLAEIRALYAEAEEQRQKILADAQEEAAAIIATAKKTHDDYNSAIEAILKEYGQDHTDNG